ncbi:MAG: 2Fe-2S iron-sulfur cluster-binding protein [Adhaeribacter sp.]
MSSHSLFLRVVEVTRETSDAITIHFEHPDQKIIVSKPGQFLTLLVPVKGQIQRRSYSLCSAPHEAPRLAVTVKRVPGGAVSNYLVDHCTAGMELEVYAPMGNFQVVPAADQARQMVLIGAGSGITPLMAMAKAVLHEEPRSRVTLIYGNRNEESVIFRQQLRQLEEGYAGRLQVVHVLSQPQAGARKGGALQAFTGLFKKKAAPQTEVPFARHTGRLNRKMLIDILQELQLTDYLDTEFYLCGPEGLMEEAREALRILKVGTDRIHKESFVTPRQKAAGEGDVLAGAEEATAGHVVTLIYEGTEYQVPVAKGQTILEAGLAQDIDLPYSCQAGLCTACRGKCRSGKVHLDEREGLSDAEIQEGYVLNCVAHPLTDDVVIEIG